MKNFNILKLLLIFILFAKTTPAFATSINFSTGNTFSVVNGNSYSVNLLVSGLPSGPPREIIAAYNIDVLYTSSLLNATGVSFTNNLGDPGLVEADVFSTITSGKVNLWSVSYLSDLELQTLQAALAGNVTLATIDFTAIANGTVNMSFDWYPGRDIKGNNDIPILGYGAPAVPEPATLFLMGSGIISLWVIRRRKRIVKDK